MTRWQVEERMGRISTASSYDAASVAQADIVVEAAFERMSVKKEIFRALDKVMPTDPNSLQWCHVSLH